jgi:hypothetical protein
MNNGCRLASEIECSEGYKKRIIGDSEESPLDILHRKQGVLMLSDCRIRMKSILCQRNRSNSLIYSCLVYKV